jgi:hypothetical protein
LRRNSEDREWWERKRKHLSFSLERIMCCKCRMQIHSVMDSGPNHFYLWVSFSSSVWWGEEVNKKQSSLSHNITFSSNIEWHTNVSYLCVPLMSTTLPLCGLNTLGLRESFLVYYGIATWHNLSSDPLICTHVVLECGVSEKRLGSEL